MSVIEVKTEAEFDNYIEKTKNGGQIVETLLAAIKTSSLCV